MINEQTAGGHPLEGAFRAVDDFSQVVVVPNTDEHNFGTFRRRRRRSRVGSAILGHPALRFGGRAVVYTDCVPRFDQKTSHREAHHAEA